MYDNLITTGKPLKQTYGMEVIGYLRIKLTLRIVLNSHLVM